MQLHQTTDYALRILVYLAIEQRVIPSSELANELVIPAKYVLRVGNRLKESRFVKTHSGSRGGYELAKELEDITIYDVVVAFEGSIKMNRCLEEDRYCSRKATPSCQVHRFFLEMQEDMERRMKKESLKRLVEIRL